MEHTTADTGAQSASPARGVELFPSRLLGFGVFTAWSSLAVSLEIELDIAALSSPIGRLFLLSALTALLYLAVAAFVHRTGRDPWTRPVFLSCGALSVLFPLLELAASLTGMLALDIVAIVCYCAATVGLFLMWNRQISAHPPKITLAAYSGSFALAACLYFLVHALGTVAFFVSLVLLPVLSCVLLHLSGQLEHGPSAEEKPLQWRVPWRPMVLVIVFTVAFGVVSHFEGNAMIPSELGRLIAGAAALATALTLFPRLDATVIAKVSALLAVAALLLCTVQGPEGTAGASKLLISIGYYGFMLFVLYTLSEICFSYHARPEWLFGIVQAAYVALSAPSGQMGNWLRETALDGGVLLSATALAAVALAVMAACLFLLTENPFAATWGIKAFRHAEGDDGSAQPIAVRDYLQNRMYRCTLIARQYGLTHREEEVLVLMAEGKSFAEMEAALVIAHGTLRAHVQHLYEKLGVHSKQEAIDFVNQWEQ